MSIQKKQFQLHPALIKQIVHNQSGTLSKALLEGVMNSVDSIFLEDTEATGGYCYIELSQTGFKITDNGKGMSAEEISELWEVFGAPHSEGDGSTFGRFRIGRAQLFGHAKTTWYTQDNVMEVDIEAEPESSDSYGYKFKKSDSFVEGMVIVGELYAPLSTSELSRIESEIKGYVKYIGLDIKLNGELISNDPAKEKWDLEDDNFYIRRLPNTDYSTNTSVYNLGALVPGFSRLPINCEVVSKNKRVFKLNTARNEVLSTCPLYQKLVDVLEVMIDKARWKDLSKNEKASLVQRFLEDQESMYRHPFCSNIINYKFFELLNDKKVSISEILNETTFIVGNREHSVIADKMHEQGLGMPIMDFVYLPDRRNMTEVIQSIFEKNWRWEQVQFKTVEEMRPYADLAFQTLDPAKDLTEKQQIAFGAIKKGFGSIVKYGQGFSAFVKDGRKIQLGDSAGTAYAWTDGVANIWIDKELSVKPILSEGFAACTEVALTLIHELCHDSNNTQSNVHGNEFNEQFRNRIEQNKEVGKVANAIFKSYASQCVKKYGQKGLSRNYKLVLDSMNGASQSR